MRCLILYFALCLTFINSISYAESLTLALNWKAEPEFGGFYYADIEGLYKKEGLDIKIQQGGAGTPTIQMVASGQVEFGIISADELLISRANGSDIIALFAVYQISPTAIMTHEDRKFKSLKDVLNSKGTLALQSGLPFVQFLKNKYKNFKVKTVPYLGGISNFQNDIKFSQQCFVTAEPLIAAHAGLKVKSFMISEEGFNPYTAVVVTKLSYLNKNKKMIKSFLKATLSGWEKYIINPDSTNQYMYKLNPSMPLEIYKLNAKTQIPLIKPNNSIKIGSMTQKRWDELTQQLLDLGIIKSKPKDPLFWVE